MYGFYCCNDLLTMILVRVNGIGTDLFLERTKEVRDVVAGRLFIIWKFSLTAINCCCKLML